MKKYLFFAAIGALVNFSQVQAAEPATVHGWMASHVVSALQRAHVTRSREAGDEAYSVKDLSCESAWSNAQGDYAFCSMTDAVTGLKVSTRMSRALSIFDLLKTSGMTPVGPRNDLWIKGASMVCFEAHTWLHPSSGDHCVVTQE